MIRRTIAFAHSHTAWATWLLFAVFALYLFVYTALSSYKFDTFRQGFDLAQNEQTIWNTAHGRFFESSPFGLIQYDFDDGPVPFELLLAIPYALFPSTYTLLFLQTLALASAAVPLYYLARDKINAWVGLLLAVAYLFHVTITRTNMYEFQLRSFVVPFFLFAFYFFEKQAFGRFLLFALLALACKSEVGLTLPMFGVYAWLTHRSPRWILTPIAVGLAWFSFVFGYFIPTYVPRDFITSVYGYRWLGNSVGEMLTTVFTRPLYVAAQVLIPGKLEYIFQSFVLLLFLPLLQPRLLIFALPNLALNLLAVSSVQYSVLYFYQPFVVGAFFLATIYGLAGTLPRITRGHLRAAKFIVAATLLVASLAFNLTWNNLALRALKNPEPPERRAAAARIINQILPDAAVAASEFLGPHLAQRQALYFFPGNNSYPFLIERVQFVAVDLRQDTSVTARKDIGALRADPAWKLVADDTDYLLFERK